MSNVPEALPDALRRFVKDAGWNHQASVYLLLASGCPWLLERDEIVQAIKTWRDGQGELVAYVDWDHVDWQARFSSTERAILELAASLAGRPPTRALSDLLYVLDEQRCRVLVTAVARAYFGPTVSVELQGVRS